ncbi:MULTISPECIES: hypothetical protein [Bacteroides]|jgi:hypothetical protein|uniref:hypothetical protein n=1 Tax=Bacteroides TaxID=816 RepID=UPI001C37978A|nr:MULTISPECIES: hypothetical protein [Bacteroides]MBV3636145.1 hypothetical protein [Bacteroides cellulosilyticus]MBV3662493.1 hypothetical protein [Bacteroides cellulosilyticus]MBV3684443.1 hypothetical protein [Bacteroides cellulosilyticus]MBV3693147.1 hypothetical protein [Bacteroides cellulosilyticus]MBV3706634.1 hypothetical protein [Bacteroides cellulosilyticus]
MNANKYSIIVLLLIPLLYSCHNNEEENGILNERMLDVVVKYETKDGIFIDTNAHIYVYYDIYTTDITPFQYKADGILIHNEQEISPNLKMFLDNQEAATIILDSTKKVTVLVESSYFPNKVSANSFSSGNMPIKATFIFKN